MEGKPQPILAHMPDYLKKSIVDLLDPPSKLSLRQVSSDFKTHVGKSATRYDELNIKLSPEYITIQLFMVKDGPALETTFVKMKDAYYTEDSDGNTLKTVDEGKFEIGAIKHLAKLFNHPKTIVNNLQLEFVGWESSGKLKRIYRRPDPLTMLQSMSDSLKKAKTRFSAETVWIYFGGEESHLLASLALMNPKPLKTICINPLMSIFMGLKLVSENKWRYTRPGSEDFIMVKFNDPHYSYNCCFSDEVFFINRDE